MLEDNKVMYVATDNTQDGPIKDWQEKIPEIVKNFDTMSKTYCSDPERPSIEIYKSQKELILFLPILGE